MNRSREPELTDSGLVILSLLLERPMHGYQLERVIGERNMRVWTDLSTSSIYYILKKLEEKGLIEGSGWEDGSRGKPKKVFSVTARGRAVWKSETLGALARPRITYTSFLMGLHNLWNIDPEEASEAVGEYQDWLRNDLDRQKSVLKELPGEMFPLNVLFEYGFTLGEAELGFLDGLMERLEKMSRKQTEKGEKE